MLEIKSKKTGEILAKIQADTLAGADLRDMHLEGADLRGADLDGAHLEFADLVEADLSDAKLQGGFLHAAQASPCFIPLSLRRDKA